jgi:hypothetical protein
MLKWYKPRIIKLLAWLLTIQAESEEGKEGEEEFLEKQHRSLKAVSSVFLVVWVLSLGNKNDTHHPSNAVRINIL